MVANVAASFALSGISRAVPFDAYVIAEDAAGNRTAATLALTDVWKADSVPVVTPVGQVYSPSSTDRLVLITHGWNSSADGWVNTLGQKICDKLAESSGRPAPFITTSVALDRGLNTGIDSYCFAEKWGVGTLNWNRYAKALDALNPLNLRGPDAAYSNAVDVARKVYKDMQLSGTKYAHLIAHSAGSNLMAEFARLLRADEPSVVIHTTLLDAFCTNPRSCDHFGRDSNWAEQYVDHRPALDYDIDESSYGAGDTNNMRETNVTLTNAYNFDVTGQDQVGVTEPSYFDVCMGDASVIVPAYYALKSEWCIVVAGTNAHAFPYKAYLLSAGVVPPSPFFSLKTLAPIGLGAKLAAWSQPSAAASATSFDPATWLGTVKARFGSGKRCVLDGLSTGSTCTPAIATTSVYAPTGTSRVAGEKSCPASSATATTISATTCGQLAIGFASKFGKAASSPLPSMVLTTVTLNDYADRLSFDYRFTSAAAGALQVFVNNQLVFVTDQTLAGTTVQSTGKFAISRLAPGDHQLRVVVKAQSLAEAAVEVSNISFDRLLPPVCRRPTRPVAEAGAFIRFLRGFTGAPLMQGIFPAAEISPTATAALESHYRENLFAYDFNNDGQLDQLIDGVLFARYALGFRGAELVQGLAVGSTRTTAQIENALAGCQ